MKIQNFLSHHGIARNPFAEEDAQTDVVFKEHCIANTYHVGWDKVFGDPSDPSTSIVFGEKGAGKTALRLQMVDHVGRHNETHPSNRLFVINYDDFNPFLDHFRDHFGGRFRRVDRLLGAWRLWDHMDAILTLGVTKLMNLIIQGTSHEIDTDLVTKLPHHQRRDLLLLAACYDQSKEEPMPVRWHAIRRRLRYPIWRTYVPLGMGIVGSLATLGLFLGLFFNFGFPREGEGGRSFSQLYGWVYGLLLFASLFPWLANVVRRSWLSRTISRRVRVAKRHFSPLLQILMRFTQQDLVAQPFPNKDRTDDRYELLGKFQNVLEQLGYTGILVLVDRLDEPHLINGQVELMRALLWPLLDNKFLKHPGVGIKMMLPAELRRYVDREDRDFYQRARLDKQNMIPSLQWTGEALYDLASSRIQACALAGKSPGLRELFDESVSNGRLIEGFRSLRVPRHLFKFLYRLLVAHCNSHTEEQPQWQISNHMFESVLAVYGKEIEAADQGTGT